MRALTAVTGGVTLACILACGSGEVPEECDIAPTADITLGDVADGCVDAQFTGTSQGEPWPDDETIFVTVQALGWSVTNDIGVEGSSILTSPGKTVTICGTGTETVEVYFRDSRCDLHGNLECETESDCPTEHMTCAPMSFDTAVDEGYRCQQDLTAAFDVTI